MSEQPRVGDPRAPKEIDREEVLQELEHRHQGGYGEEPGIGWVLDELAELDILRFREPADDPSKDPVGTVRRDAIGRTAHKIDTDSLPWAEYTEGFTTYDWVADEDVAGWEVIGAAPGTPAAEAQEPKYGLFQTPPEKPVPYSQWQRRKYDWRPQSGWTPHAPDDETREVPS